MPTMQSLGFTALDERRRQRPLDVQAAVLSSSPNPALGGAAKRSIDFLIALNALIFLAPLFLLVAMAVKLSSPGPVLYGHIRVGHDGQRFRCWKFRSMVENGDALLERYFAKHPEERAEWVTNRKLREDPRVTRIGAVLRTYSVDELPQIFNVLTGEMSLVGPRPVVEEELDMYGEVADLYLRTRPGITGLWQVSGRSDTSYEHRVSLDADYVSNWSLSRDISIILRTIPAVLLSKGSY